MLQNVYHAVPQPAGRCGIFAEYGADVACTRHHKFAGAGEKLLKPGLPGGKSDQKPTRTAGMCH